MASPLLLQATFKRLERELKDLTTRGRIEVAEEIERAREEGDLRENAGYHAAKDKQGHMEGRIRQLEHLLENAETTESLRVYTIVYEGDSRADAEKYVVGDPENFPDLGRKDVEIMTPTSPLGAALAEAEAITGQTVEYETPNGKLRVQIVEIEECKPAT